MIETNPLTKFHDDRTINVEKNAPPPGGHVFKTTETIIRKNDPPPGGYVFKTTETIFKLIQDIIGTNHLTKKNAPPPDGHFHEDWTINVASRVKNAPPLGSHDFQAKDKLLSKFHEDRKINVASRVLTRKNAPPPGGHVLKPTSLTFELIQDIIGMNLQTKFHEDQTINVASRVKNALPLGSHVFQANVTIFKPIQDIIETNLPTKFHEDWTINVPSRELTTQMLTPNNAQQTTHNRQRTKGDHKSSP
ncbi:hypothetical protein DPMN_041144 [Dreissena polymorpha]|uniref:Uncharacterized protein n=1 Tax=Dreissena polymorpha TaxID=45954 RepID=A0A9D4CX99_DREPO|nr:hypothetical protein DPMN_041144 [Dreissena polymorpha]